MLITLDIKNESMKDNFLNFIATLDYIDIKSDLDIQCKKVDHSKNKFSKFAGMWEDRDINIDSIRQEAWKK
jgi:hypothetical protein